MNITQSLCEWALTLPYWEQLALDQALSGVEPDEVDYDELLQFLIEDSDLAPKEAARRKLGFAAPSSLGATDAGESPRLVSISNLQHVNALVGGQVLEFGSALTAIYGANGAGKSGYVRVLGCAGFTRGDREILPNVVNSDDHAGPLTAEIEVCRGQRSDVIRYQIGDPCPALSSVYVFDSTSVEVHLTKKNTLSFSPAGLASLRRLAEVSDRVRDLLQSRIDECSLPHSFQSLFQGETEVAQLIANLDAHTDVECIRRLASLTDGEVQRIRQLDLEIARLKTRDVSQEKAELQRAIDDVTELLKKITQAEEGLSPSRVHAIQSSLLRYSQEQEAVAQFRALHLDGHVNAGAAGDVWRDLIAAARAFVELEQAAEGTSYPQPDSRCPLCRQPLSEQAYEWLQRVWRHFDQGSERRLDDAERELRECQSAVADVDLEFFSVQTVSHRYLQKRDLSLQQEVAKLIAAYQTQRQAILDALSAVRSVVCGPPPDSVVPKLQGVIAALQSELAELETTDPQPAIAALADELLMLQHRQTLSEHLDEVVTYVQQRAWAQRAQRALPNTRHITRKHNQLFTALVTDRYVETFQAKLNELGRPLKVRIETQGHKGSAIKQIVVEAGPDDQGRPVPPDKVLSEGEKRIVALIDFLTEVELDAGSGAIVLDDPVTSFDLEWRELVALMLATEANRRQVIAFTHDLPFLYYLHKCCDQQHVAIRTHWIQRIGEVPGYVFLDNSPALERDYRKSEVARQLYGRACKAPPAEQERLLREGFGALRTCYEAFIIFELFNEVVLRFEERLSFGRLAGIVWDDSIATTVVQKCEALSRHIEGHLHSDAIGATKPTPQMLMAEIEEFDSLKRKLKELKKAKERQA